MSDHRDIGETSVQTYNRLYAKKDAEIDRLRAERNKWMEYATGDRAELALKMEALRAELAEAKAADAERDAMQGALSFYADESNWHTPPHCPSTAVLDCGSKARAALASSPAGREG